MSLSTFYKFRFQICYGQGQVKRFKSQNIASKYKNYQSHSIHLQMYVLIIGKTVHRF